MPALFLVMLLEHVQPFNISIPLKVQAVIGQPLLQGGIKKVIKVVKESLTLKKDIYNPYLNTGWTYYEHIFTNKCAEMIVSSTGIIF